MKFYKHDSWEYGKSNSVWWRTWNPTSFIGDSKEKHQNTLWRKHTRVDMLSSAEDPPNNYVSQENPLQTPFFQVQEDCAVDKTARAISPRY